MVQQIMLIKEFAERKRERKNLLPNARTGRQRVRVDRQLQPVIDAKSVVVLQLYVRVSGFGR